MAHEMFLGEDFYGKAKNIYTAIMMIANRSRKIAEQQRKEMDAYLSQVEMADKFEDGDEGMIEDAPVLHEPMLQFEKSTTLALREMISDKLQDTSNVATVVEKDEEEEAPKKEAIPYKLDIDFSADE